MATYSELKAIFGSQIKNSDAIAHIDIDEFDKVPDRYRKINDEFVKANSNLKGIMNYDTLGYTEPEDYRHCFQNNQALSRIEELMPYIDKMNIPQADRNDSRYSSYILPIGDEILRAKDDCLSEDKLDYLCEVVAQRDWGAPHWAREITAARKYLRDFEVSDVQKFMEGPTDNRQSVSFYIESFYDAYSGSWRTENPEVKDEMMKGIAVIQKANDSSEAFGLYQAMNFEGIEPEVADKIHESCNMMINAPKDKNPNIGGGYKILRFDDNHSLGRTEAYVQSITELVKEHKSVFEQNPELICDMTKDFIDNGGTQSFISEYFHGEPDKLHDYVAPYYMAETQPKVVQPQPCGGDDSNYEMFYTGGGGSYKNNTQDNIAAYAKTKYPSLKDKSLDEIKDYHIYWGSDEAGGYGLKSFYNGDTYVLFDDIEKLPDDMKHDAMTMCDGYRRDRRLAKVEQSEPEPSKSDNALQLDLKGIKYRTSKKGGDFYSGYVEVPDNVSKNGRAYITFKENQVETFDSGKTAATVGFKNDSRRKISVMNPNGKYEDIHIEISQLKGYNDIIVNGRQKAIEIANSYGNNINVQPENQKYFGE